MGLLGVDKGEVRDAGLAGGELDHHVAEVHPAANDALGPQTARGRGIPFSGNNSPY
jgi:hypothetical protein